MQALEKLLGRRTQTKPIHEDVQPVKIDRVVDEKVVVLPIPELIDKNTHPLRFREGFEKYADDWNSYASSVRLPFQEKALEEFLKLSSFFSRRIESSYMKSEREMNIKSLEDERSEVSLNGDVQLEDQKKKAKIKKLNKEIGRRKNFLNNSIHNEEAGFQKSKEGYLKSKAGLKRADENFATNLDTDRLVFYCYCNSITKRDEIDRLTVMSGRKKSLSLEDLFLT